MPETPDVPAPLPPGETFLGHLANLPAMFGAISRLIGKGAMLGEAWLDIPQAEGERRAQAIRDDQAAHSALTKVILEAAGPEAIKDPDLLKRAISSWGAMRIRKQTNKEKVAAKAVEAAQASPMGSDAKQPTDDWMNLFESHAEKASSEELQALWGRVLDGEVRLNGTFSLRGMNFIATLDNDMASIVEKFTPYLIEQSAIINIEIFNQSPFYDDLISLSASGLIAMSSSFYITYDEATQSEISCGKLEKVTFQAEAHKRYEFRGSILTKLGREIFSLAHGSSKREMNDEFINVLRSVLGHQATITTI